MEPFLPVVRLRLLPPARFLPGAEISTLLIASGIFLRVSLLRAVARCRAKLTEVGLLLVVTGLAIIM